MSLYVCALTCSCGSNDRDDLSLLYKGMVKWVFLPHIHGYTKILGACLTYSYCILVKCIQENVKAIKKKKRFKFLVQKLVVKYAFENTGFVRSQPTYNIVYRDLLCIAL